MLADQRVKSRCQIVFLYEGELLSAYFNSETGELKGRRPFTTCEYKITDTKVGLIAWVIAP